MSEASSTILLLPAERSFEGACSSDFWYRLRMEPTEEQFNALGNYRDIITQNASQVAEALGISMQTLIGWTEGNGEPTSEQADKILEFLRDKNKAG
jgi:transcriptional regulator with XRE-family HTH domain